MQLEIKKAYKRRMEREKKEQEKIDLAPVKNLQPKTRAIRYDNMKSAMAEEGILVHALLDPSLMDRAKGLKGEDFSVPMLGKVYDQLVTQHQKGLEVTLAAVTDLTAEEMSHVAGICQRREGPVNESAFMDCVDTVLGIRQASRVSTDADLLAFQNKLKESKGTR
jgi:DNA primase